MTCFANPLRSGRIGAMQLLVMILAIVGTTAWSAHAVVVPREVGQELQRRFDAFIRADDYSEVELSGLPGDDWYTPARFPELKHGASSVFGLDQNLDPVTRMLLLVVAREGTLPHVRYRITYRLGVAPGAYSDVQHAYVEVTRFNLGPALHAQLAAQADGSYPVASKDVFGVGPHVSWRFVTTPIQGLNAAIVRASRKEISTAGAKSADCLDVSCLALTDPRGPQGHWQRITPAPLPAPVYVASEGLLPGPARVAEKLFAYATRAGLEPAFGAFADQPQLVLVVSKAIEGQVATINGLLHQPHVMDDAVAEIWIRRLQTGPAAIDWRRRTVSARRRAPTAH